MADYTASGSEGTFGDVRNPAKNTLTINKEPDAYELKREHYIISERGKQLGINLVGLEGGRKYVTKRLSRFAGESKIDWEGGSRGDGVKVTGRKQQSHSFPYLRRIADKIDQYVFSEAPVRDGIPPEILEDASADGQSLNSLMKQANDYVTACKWCWIGVDAPSYEGQVSVKQKASQKIRPYIQVYSPLAVRDWKFDAIGKLEWLITECFETVTSDVMTEPQEYRVRRIWTRGACRTVYMQLRDNKWTVKSDEERSLSYAGVPFVPVGKIDDRCHTFDDIESINRTIMDLESVNRANFFKRCYPQLVLPVDCLRNMADTYQATGKEAAELVIGMNYPILVGKDDVTPQYLMPSGADMTALRSELQQLKANMFDSVGLMLQRESKQIASGESKAWDFLDVAQVMSARAGILEEAERKVADIIAAWDSTVQGWVPVYNRDFDVGDFQQEINALVMAGNVPMPAEMSRAVLQKLMDRIDRVGASLEPEQRKIIKDAIDGFDPTAITYSTGFE